MTPMEEATPANTTSFVYAVCQIGAEPALKAEVAAAHPGWRFAFSRPGLVTWRSDAPVRADLRLDAVFARSYGASLGRAEDEEQVLQAARRLREAAGAPIHLHVFPRDHAPPGDDADADPLAPRVAALTERLRAAGAAPLLTQAALPREQTPTPLFAPASRAAPPGALILDVIVAAEDEPLWLGYHAQTRERSPHPGGRPPLVLPAEAPSRAYLKLEQGLCWSHLPLRRGQVAVEIGSAPGGASYALLRRGLTVVGVDPGAMDPRVLLCPAFSHCQLPLGEVRREQLPPQVDWLLMDVNLAPQVALHGVRRLVAALRPTLRGVLFTLKLNEWRMAAEVPALLARVAGMGLSRVRATQLPANRREICVAAEVPPRPRSRRAG